MPDSKPVKTIHIELFRGRELNGAPTLATTMMVDGIEGGKHEIAGLLMEIVVRMLQKQPGEAPSIAGNVENQIEFDKIVKDYLDEVQDKDQK